MVKVLALLCASLTALCSMGYELAFASFISRTIGNEVLGQTLTIGIFLLFMGAGSAWAERRFKKPLIALIRIELLLCLAGMSAPALMQLCLGAMRLQGWISPMEGQPSDLYLSLLALNAPVVCIGFLTGAELPLIFKILKEKVNSFDHNIVLFLNYMGGLAAGIFFYNHLSDGASFGRTFQFFAVINLTVCGALFLFKAPKRYAIGLAGLVAFLPYTEGIYRKSESFAINVDYYGYRLTALNQKSLKNLSNTLQVFGKVTRITSPYQTIDLVKKNALDYKGIKSAQSLDVYINRHIQFNTENHELYHQTFSHAFLNLINKSPSKALILGGGDGILANELLKYPQIKEITLVDLDPEMTKLASRHPALARINGGSLEDERVNIIHQDAFKYLSELPPNSLTTVFIDFPFPNSSDLKKLFSLEFYGLLKRALAKNGFAVLDAPIATMPESKLFSNGSKTLIHTIKRAEFKTIFAYGPLTPFVVLSKASFAPKFDYDKIKNSPHIHSSTYLNLTKIDIRSLLEMKADPKHLNSIFKPGVFK